MKTDRITVKQLTFSVGMVVAVEVIIYTIALNSHVDPLLLTGFGRLVQILLLFTYFLLIQKNIRLIGLGHEQLKHGLIRGLVWSAILGVITLIIFAAVYIAGINPILFFKTSLTGSALNTISYIIVGGFIAPVAEEFFFRGVLYGFFRRYGVILALVLTSILFVMAHLNKGIIPITQIIGGIIFSISYEKEKSLITPITIHIMANLAIFSLAYV